MTKRTPKSIAMLLTVCGLLAALVGGTAAQGTDATPATGDYFTTHPAHIHSGSCETLGDVVYPLNDVVATNLAVSTFATPDAAPSPPALASTPVITTGQSTMIEASLDDLLAAEHAINVHQSADAMDVYIACGDIVGEAANGELTVDLVPLNESGYMGLATLEDNGDGTTTVTVDLIHPGMGTPSATPQG